MMKPARMKPEMKVVAGVTELSWRAAEEFVRRAKEAVHAKGSFTVALSGGSTPRSVYALLVSTAEIPFRAQAPWDKTHFFWGDERHVPPEHSDSNYRMAHDTMLSKVPVPSENVHRIKSENPDAGKAAEEYAQTLREHFKLDVGQWPRFDLVLLGMGADGHTASLFPGTSVLQEQILLVAAPWVEKFHSYRITLTFPVLNNAACVMFLVSGADKAGTLRAVLQGDKEAGLFPAQRVCPPNGKLLWLVDRPATRLLHFE